MRVWYRFRTTLVPFQNHHGTTLYRDSSSTPLPRFISPTSLLVQETPMEPAPYSGLMVKTLEDDQNRQQKLEEQSIQVTVNNTQETLRPEAVFIKGVDSLSTNNILAFINYYVNYNVKPAENEENSTELQYEPLPIDDQMEFRVQWVNDTSVTVVCKTHEDAKRCLLAISINSNAEGTVEEEDVTSLVQERETKPYNPVVEFQRRTDLSNRLNINQNDDEKSPQESTEMDEDESAVVLYTRQAFQSDRKVKNAAAYSRYYLLHGEPERKPRRPRPHRPNRGRARDYNDEEDDLFAHKLRAKRAQENGDEDLFANRGDRERSPQRDRSRSPMRMEE